MILLVVGEKCPVLRREGWSRKGRIENIRGRSPAVWASGAGLARRFRSKEDISTLFLDISFPDSLAWGFPSADSEQR